MASSNPYLIEQPQQQQQQSPLGGLGGLGQMSQMFGGGQSGGLSGLFGGGATGGTATGATTAAGGTAAGGATAASGAGGGSAASAGGSALMSNPIGWIAAAALAQNVAHNKGISSWQAGLKGQAGANIGDYYMKDKWGMDDDNPLYDAAGVLGWGSGGGIFNPSYLNKKIFGSTD